MSNFIINSSIFIHNITSVKIFTTFFIIFAVYFILRKQYFFLKIFATSIVATSALTILLKNLTKIARPENAILTLTDYAFPSGHAAIAFAILTFGFFLIFHEDKKGFDKNITANNGERNITMSCEVKNIFAGILIIFAIVISGSRLVLNVHTFWQTLFGAVLGVVVSVLVILFFRKK